MRYIKVWFGVVLLESTGPCIPGDCCWAESICAPSWSRPWRSFCLRCPSPRGRLRCWTRCARFRRFASCNSSCNRTSLLVASRASEGWGRGPRSWSRRSSTWDCGACLKVDPSSSRLWLLKYDFYCSVRLCLTLTVQTDLVEVPSAWFVADVLVHNLVT